MAARKLLDRPRVGLMLSANKRLRGKKPIESTIKVIAEQCRQLVNVTGSGFRPSYGAFAMSTLRSTLTGEIVPHLDDDVADDNKQYRCVDRPPQQMIFPDTLTSTAATKSRVTTARVHDDGVASSVALVLRAIVMEHVTTQIDR